MKDPLDPQKCAQILSALAAPERLRVIRFLADGRRNVTEIAESLGIRPVNLSHHLTVLKHAALIRSKKEGWFVWYSLRPGMLEEVLNAGIPRDALNLGCCRLEMPAAESDERPRKY